jgi:hypothetical protein
VITTKADNQRRLTVPQAKPGQIYAVHENADGSLTLKMVTMPEQEQLKCHLDLENGFTVAVPEQPIDEHAIKELLADFP